MQAEIDELLGRGGKGPSRDRFDPDVMSPKLEKYVDEQVLSFNQRSAFLSLAVEHVMAMRQ